MPLLCLNCFEVLKDELKYNLDYILTREIDCPKSSCTGYWDGKVIEVDELMLPTIIELNKKKYITSNCCSGHYYMNAQGAVITADCVSTYIGFDERYDFEDTNLPSGFEIELGKDNVVIRKNRTRQKIVSDKLFKQIIKDAESLYEWAKKLPPLC